MIDTSGMTIIIMFIRLMYALFTSPLKVNNPYPTRKKKKV